MLTSLPDDLGAFRELCTRVPSWSGMLDYAGRQGVEGVLWHHLRDADILRREVQDLAARQRAFEQLAQWPLHTALDQALRALDATGIRAIALKGPVLGERIYPHPSLRSSTDLDLLVLPSELDRAIAALASIGYQAATGRTHEYDRRHSNQICLFRPGSPPIDLHFAAHDRFGVIVAPEPLIQTAVTYRTASGAQTWILSPEEELLFLTVHAAGHAFGVMSLLYELKLFIRAHPILDWSVIRQRSIEQGMHHVVEFAFTLLNRRLGIVTPMRREFRATSRPRMWLASALLLASTSSAVTRARHTAASLAFHAVLCHRSGAALRMLSRVLLRETRRRLHRRFPDLFPETWSA
jgi:hypothetical protein